MNSSTKDTLKIALTLIGVVGVFYVMNKAKANEPAPPAPNPNPLPPPPPPPGTLPLPLPSDIPGVVPQPAVPAPAIPTPAIPIPAGVNPATIPGALGTIFSQGQFGDLSVGTLVTAKPQAFFAPEGTYRITSKAQVVPPGGIFPSWRYMALNQSFEGLGEVEIWQQDITSVLR